jgi:hypothetical protein
MSKINCLLLWGPFVYGDSHRFIRNSSARVLMDRLLDRGKEDRPLKKTTMILYSDRAITYSNGSLRMSIMRCRGELSCQPKFSPQLLQPGLRS